MPLKSPYSVVLWDVDGTIVDASVGILRRLTKVLTDAGRPAPTREELVHWIGPPMFESFQQQGHMPVDEARKAVLAYRALGKADGYTTNVATYPEIPELIRDLHAAGVPQGVSSSKPEIQVRALMEHFGLIDAFAAITGSTPDEETLAHKSDIVAEELRRLEAAGVDVSRPVLVGDRHHDVEGGNANGVPVIFVRWGFSEPEEADGAVAAADDPAALRALLLGPEASTRL